MRLRLPPPPGPERDLEEANAKALTQTGTVAAPEIAGRRATMQSAPIPTGASGRLARAEEPDGTHGNRPAAQPASCSK
jgi:hypothetical protein